MKTIMVVDDSASIRQVVGLTLKQAGYAVLEACDGQEALGKLRSAPVDAIITDMNMPNMNGLDFIRQYRSTGQSAGVPIVFLTTESDDGLKQQARSAGALGWMMKPFKPEQLLAVMKKVVG